jgi:hypothetical protein
MNNSDPYSAYTYDKLHRDDIGKWGHHLWPLTKSALERRGKLGQLSLLSVHISAFA